MARSNVSTTSTNSVSDQLWSVASLWRTALAAANSASADAMTFARQAMSAPELSTCAASFSMAAFVDAMFALRFSC